jgi:cell division protein FtsQ
MKAPNLRYDRIMWVAFIGLIAMVMYYAVRQRRMANTDRTVVEVKALPTGEKLISDADVRQVLVRNFGQSLNQTSASRLDIEAIEKTLEKDPFVRNADVYVDQTNNLNVKIEQREPMLRIMDVNGGNYYMDKNGHKMPPSNHFAARVIVATGKISPYTPDFNQLKNNTLRDVFRVAQTILADEFLDQFIQQIHVSNTGEMMLTPLVGDQIIILGSARRLEDKLERLKIFYREAMPHEGWRKYRTINLKYSGQVVCKK